MADWRSWHGWALGPCAPAWCMRPTRRHGWSRGHGACPVSTVPEQEAPSKPGGAGGPPRLRESRGVAPAVRVRWARGTQGPKGILGCCSAAVLGVPWPVGARLLGLANLDRRPVADSWTSVMAGSTLAPAWNLPPALRFIGTIHDPLESGPLLAIPDSRHLCPSRHCSLCARGS